MRRERQRAQAGKTAPKQQHVPVKQYNQQLILMKFDCSILMNRESESLGFFCLFFFFSKRRKEIGICFVASVAVDDVHISWFEDNQVENDGTDKKCLLCVISLV